MEIKSGTRVLIIGCGYLGTQLAKKLLQKDCQVSGTTRSQERLPLLRNLGIKPILADITTAQGFAEFGKVDVIILSPAPSRQNPQSYTELYDTGISRLMTYLHFYPPTQRIIYTSSIGVYELGSGDWVNETTPTFPTTPRTKALVSAEKWVLESKVPSLVARLGGLYGPERNRVQAIKENKIGVADSKKFINLIHIEDAANCLEFLIQNGESGEVYNVVDGNPPVRKEMINFIADNLGITNSPVDDPNTNRTDRQKQNKRCSNKKIIDLGFKFKYPSYSEGYKQILKLMSVH